MTKLIEEPKYDPELVEVPLGLIIPTGPSTSSVRGQGRMHTVVTLRHTGNHYTGDRYVVGDGNQRVHEALEAGQETILAWVYPEETPDNVFLTESLKRNYLRRRNPLHEGDMVRTLLTQGYTIKGIARLLGTSTTYLENLVGVASLPEPFRLAIESGKLAPSTAQSVAKLDPTKRAQAEVILMDKGRLTADDVKQLKKQETKERAETLRLFEDESPQKMAPKQRLQAVARSLLATTSKGEMEQWIREL